jgi:hypothetical protein
VSWSKGWKAFAWSLETTPVSDYWGNFWPIPNIAFSWVDPLRWAAFSGANPVSANRLIV